MWLWFSNSSLWSIAAFLYEPTCKVIVLLARFALFTTADKQKIPSDSQSHHFFCTISFFKNYLCSEEICAFKCKECIEAQCFHRVFRLRNFSSIEHINSLFFKSFKQRSKEAILLGHADFGPSSRKGRLLSGKSLELTFHSDRAESRKEYFEIRWIS